MPIPERFLDELIARTDIVDLVGEYVRLTKKGRNYWGLCPFHSEKTPSFSVSPDKQIFKCFGCGKGGGAINFIMELDSLPFRDAVGVLAKRVNLEVPDTGGFSAGMKERREKLLTINKAAARVFHKWLYAPEGAAGLAYLQRRGLSRGTLTRFGLGFAPDRWDGLLTALAEQGWDKADLLDAGLAVSNKDGRIYDRFRNRVMFPIIDIRGDVIGFGGRVMDDSTPKYLYSPDTPVYNKSRNVFALNIAKKSRAGRVILTEGYMDTISLHQAGFDCAVASLGTSLTADHAKLLSRFTKEVILCYDGDTAGVQAANRAIPMLEKTGLKVRVLRITGAKDPDEFIKTFGREAFARLLDRSENYVAYNLKQLQASFSLEDPLQRSEFARAGAELLAELDSPVEREVYAGQLAQQTGVGKDAILQEIKRCRSQRLWKAKKKQARRTLTPVNQVQPKDRRMRYDNPRSARAEEGILRLLMLDGSLAKAADGLTPEQFSSPVLGKIYGVLLSHLSQGRPLQLGALEGELEEREITLLAEILGRPAALENGAAAMADYRAVIETEQMKRENDTDEAVLLAARDNYRKKKSI